MIMSSFPLNQLLAYPPFEAMLIAINEQEGTTLSPKHVTIDSIRPISTQAIGVTLKSIDADRAVGLGEVIVERIHLASVFNQPISVSIDGEILSHDVANIVSKRTGVVFDEGDIIAEIIDPENGFMRAAPTSLRWYGSIPVLSDVKTMHLGTVLPDYIPPLALELENISLSLGDLVNDWLEIGPVVAAVPVVGLPIDHITLPPVVAAVPVDNLPVEDVTLPPPVVGVPTSELSDVSIDITLPPLRAGVPESSIGDYLPGEISLSVDIPPYEPSIRVVDISTLLNDYITLTPVIAENPTMALSTISLPDIRLPRPSVPQAGSGTVQLSDVLDDYLSMSSEWVLSAEEDVGLPQFREPYEVLLMADDPNNPDISYIIRAADLNTVLPGSIVEDYVYELSNLLGGGEFEINLPDSPAIDVEAIRLDWREAYEGTGSGIHTGVFTVTPNYIRIILVKFSPVMNDTWMTVKLTANDPVVGGDAVSRYMLIPSFRDESENYDIIHTELNEWLRFYNAPSVDESRPDSVRYLLDNSLGIQKINKILPDGTIEYDPSINNISRVAFTLYPAV